MAKDKISPGMQQYLDVKKDYPEAFYFPHGRLLRTIL